MVQPIHIVKFSEDSPDATGSGEDSAPRVLAELVQQAGVAGATDIHLQMRGPTGEVAFRLDGCLTPVRTLPPGLAERVCGRIKFLARLKTYQESLPQDGRIDRETLHAPCDVRVATYPTVTGEKIVLRLFQDGGGRSLEELGLAGDALVALVKMLGLNAGLLLLTGPAGSGKTTTIYACLRALAAQPGRHIITVEDPVEQVLPGIMQTEVNEARGLDFSCAARHLLRQDPQVLVIGEIRDEATAQVALRAALTGHLVISTLHAGSCRGVFERLAAFSPDITAIGSATGLVVNQRLVRRLCHACQGKGCPTCLQTGFRGRLLLAEFLTVDDSIRQHLFSREFGRLTAVPALEARAREAVQAGLTTDAEVRRCL